MSDTAAQYSENDVVATYDRPEDARAAMTMLERHGVDGSRIELVGPGEESAQRPITNDEMRHVDLDSTAAVGKRFTVVSFVAAIVVAGLCAVLGYAIAGDATGAFVGAVGGFVVGGLLGFLYGGYTALPTNPDYGDTFVAEEGPISVAVHAVDLNAAEAAAEALRGTDARRLAMAGPDGRLRDL